MEKDRFLSFDGTNQTFAEIDNSKTYSQLLQEYEEMKAMLEELLDTNKDLWGEEESRAYQIKEIQQLLTKINQ